MQSLCKLSSQRSHLEIVARNEYTAGENRDPTACTLLYFALGKVKLVHGLWKQAAWHKEQGLMLKFLSNDFSEPRWKTAALKNAYALLSKRRFGQSEKFSASHHCSAIRSRICCRVFPSRRELEGCCSGMYQAAVRFSVGDCDRSSSRAKQRRISILGYSEEHRSSNRF